MGLDINLYWYKDLKASEEREEKYRERSEEIYDDISKRRKRGGNDMFSKVEQDEYTKRRIELAMALDMQATDDVMHDFFLGDDHPNNKKQINLPSVRHPKEELFKIGYFRSSYNAGGINSVVGNAIGGDVLHDIFPQGGDVSCFCPDWKASLGTAIRIRDKYLAYLKKVGSMRMSSINPLSLNSPAPQNEIHSDRTAMQVFMKEQAGKKKRDKERQGKTPGPHDFSEEYSDLHGDFFFGDQPLQVRAILHGKAEGSLGGGVGVYIVYEIPGKKIENDPYAISLDVVVETCEWVLDKKDPQNYYLHWSG